jgi:hypothetical protein
MDLRMNEGYIITDSIHIGEYEFVLGVSQYIDNDFVTWRCNDGNYYYWGHYHNDLFSAQKDLVERAADKVRELQEVLDAKKAMEPTLSPWGKVQTCKELCRGVYSVSTAGHGGLMAHLDVANKVFSVAAQQCGFTEGHYLCFEEDCDEQVALRELMDKKLFHAPVNDRFPPGQYEKVIDASIQANHPDYWNFRKTHLLKSLENGKNVRKKEKERER